MIGTSVTYINKKAQEQSWIDDPFGIEAEGWKRMPQRTLAGFVQELVAMYARDNGDTYTLTVDMLPCFEQNELSRLYIEHIGREIENACYGDDESINSDYMCALLDMLQNNCLSTRTRFAEVVQANIVKYYTKPLNELLDTACNWRKTEEMENAGYRAFQDEELEWRRYK